MPFYKIRPKSGTAQQWKTANTVLNEREIGFEYPDGGLGTGIVQMKMGDGVTPWNDLPYALVTPLTKSDIVNEESDAKDKIPSAGYIKQIRSELLEPNLIVTEETIGPFSVNNNDAITEELTMIPPEGYSLVLPILGQTGSRYAQMYSCVLNSTVENGYIIQLANYSGFNAGGITPKMYFLCQKIDKQ